MEISCWKSLTLSGSTPWELIWAARSFSTSAFSSETHKIHPDCFLLRKLLQQDYVNVQIWCHFREEYSDLVSKLLDTVPHWSWLVCLSESRSLWASPADRHREWNPQQELPLVLKTSNSSAIILWKNNTCMTVSRHVQLTVHKYGLEARLGPGFNFNWIAQELVMDKRADRREGEW